MDGPLHNCISMKYDDFNTNSIKLRNDKRSSFLLLIEVMINMTEIWGWQEKEENFHKDIKITSV